jgi:hypothetical protein
MKYEDLLEIIEEETEILLEEYSSHVIAEWKIRGITNSLEKGLNKYKLSLSKITPTAVREMVRNIYWLIAAAKQGLLTSVETNMNSIVDKAIHSWSVKEKEK